METIVSYICQHNAYVDHIHLTYIKQAYAILMLYIKAKKKKGFINTIPGNLFKVILEERKWTCV